VHPIREVLIAPDDAARHMATVAHAIGHYYNGDDFRRVIYTESHDEVANGKAQPSLFHW
jgi:1,4-alpha-glucan branching enzyme